MFVSVDALNLDFHEADSRGVRHRDPSIPSQLERVDRIRHHCPTDSEIVLRDRLCNAIPGIINGLTQQPGIPDGLLHRVYAQMHGADLTGQFPRYGRLPGSG